MFRSSSSVSTMKSLLDGAVEYEVSATRLGWIGEWENAIPYNGSEVVSLLSPDRPIHK